MNVLLSIIYRECELLNPSGFQCACGNIMASSCVYVAFVTCVISFLQSGGGTFFSLIYNAFEIIRNLNIHFILKGAFNISKM